jgi:hypothetical protein
MEDWTMNSNGKNLKVSGKLSTANSTSELLCPDYVIANFIKLHSSVRHIFFAKNQSGFASSYRENIVKTKLSLSTSTEGMLIRTLQESKSYSRKWI